jgi:hypothetical protein
MSLKENLGVVKRRDSEAAIVVVDGHFFNHLHFLRWVKTTGNFTWLKSGNVMLSTTGLEAASKPNIFMRFLVIKLKVVRVEVEQSLVLWRYLCWGVVKTAWVGMVERGLGSK